MKFLCIHAANMFLDINLLLHTRSFALCAVALQEEIGTRVLEEYPEDDEDIAPTRTAAPAEKEKEQAMSIAQVTDMVQKFVIASTPPPAASAAASAAPAPSRNRVQGGWAAPPPSRGGWGRGGRGGGTIAGSAGVGWGQMKKSSTEGN